MDITLGNRNEVTKRFNFVIGDDGDVSFDDTEAHAVFTSVAEHRRSWWADETHGSDLHTLKNVTGNTQTQARAMALEGLSPLENENTITKARAVAAVERRDALERLAVDVHWSTPGGDPQNERVEV